MSIIRLNLNASTVKILAPTVGATGKSAYEIAVLNGFVGTEQEWLDSLGQGSLAGTAMQTLSDESGTLVLDFNKTRAGLYVQDVASLTIALSNVPQAASARMDVRILHSGAATQAWSWDDSIVWRAGEPTIGTQPANVFITLIVFPGGFVIGEWSEKITTITIDTTAPSKPTITGVEDDLLPVTGNVANGGSTNDATPKISGTAEANSTVEVFDGTLSLGKATADSTGLWTLQLSSPLLNGARVLTAIATDAAGNTASSAVYGINIDTSSPLAGAISNVKDDVGNKQGVIADKGVTDDTTPTLSGTGEAGTTVSVYDNDKLLGTTTVKTDGSWSYTPTTTLSDGTHPFTVTLTDKAGNVSAKSTAYTVTLNTTAPTIASVGNGSITFSGGSVSTNPTIVSVGNGSITFGV